MDKISPSEQWKIWSKVALHSFGGPAGQIAVIHKIVVEEKKLISEERFLHALNFCMLLPGPEAQQLATYMGWLMSGWRGGVIAGGLFILPGFLSILLLSYLYVFYAELTLLQGVFYGMKPAIIVIVTGALIRISKKALNGLFYWSIAVFAFISLFFLNIPFPMVVILSAILGVLYGKFKEHHDLVTDIQAVSCPPFSASFQVLFIWGLIWVAPIILVFICFGEGSTFHAMNMFFSKMSMVTFGGAYSALSYVAQKAVDVFGWLKATEMLDGLGMAETTPGPLIQVVQYVGFMGAYRFPDLASPLTSAFIGAVLATWMTFAPCFLWIFLFAPYVEYIRGQKIFSDALKTITSAVVGVIFNLSLWFMLKALFTVSNHVSLFPLNFDYPVLNTIDFYAAGICLFAFVLQFKFKQGLFTVLGTCMVIGTLIKFLT